MSAPSVFRQCTHPLDSKCPPAHLHLCILSLDLGIGLQVKTGLQTLPPPLFASPAGQSRTCFLSLLSSGERCLDMN